MCSSDLWLKTYTINKIRSWSHTQFSAGSPLYQNVTVGGQTADGKDATNLLSWLIIRTWETESIWRWIFSAESR